MSERVLVLRFGSLGDVVLTFGACEALARGRPQVALTYVVKQAYSDLVRSQPWAAEVIELSDQDRDLAGTRRLRSRLAAASWDAVLDLQDNPRSRALSQGLAPRLVRWSKRGVQRRLWVWGRPLRRLGFRFAAVRPAWLRFQDAAARLGAASPEPPRVHLPPEALRESEEFWRRWGPGEPEAVALAPAAAWPTKEWPERNWVSLGQHLVSDGHAVVVVATAEERDRLGELSRWIDGEPRAAWATGRLTWIAAILSRCRAAVVPDSGLLHLAAAVGTPVVALFGSTVPELGFAPAGSGHRVLERPLPCRPCAVHGRRRCPLGHHACLRSLERHEVRLSVAETVRAVAPAAEGPPIRAAVD